jgi:hypothetical protein
MTTVPRCRRVAPALVFQNLSAYSLRVEPITGQARQKPPGLTARLGNDRPIVIDRPELKRAGCQDEELPLHIFSSA